MSLNDLPDVPNLDDMADRKEPSAPELTVSKSRVFVTGIALAGLVVAAFTAGGQRNKNVLELKEAFDGACAEPVAAQKQGEKITLTLSPGCTVR